MTTLPFLRANAANVSSGENSRREGCSFFFSVVMLEGERVRSVVGHRWIVLLDCTIIDSPFGEICLRKGNLNLVDEYEPLVECIASGGLSPDIGSWKIGHTREDAAIGGEGTPCETTWRRRGDGVGDRN